MDYTNIAQKSCNRFRNTGCNFTTDNFFSSAPLAQHHLEKDFIVLGTLQQNKADILPLIPSKPSEFYSTDFRFSGSLTMFSCVRNRLLCTMHHSKVEDGKEVKKTRSDHILRDQRRFTHHDQMVGTYSCKHQTPRWPTVLWYNLLDIPTVNAYTFSQLSTLNSRIASAMDDRSHTRSSF